MSGTCRILVAGGAGRMGRMLIRAVGESAAAELAGVLVRTGHDWAGRDVGSVMGGPEIGVAAAEEMDLAGVDAVIDFTAPDAASALASRAAEAGTALVLGTTGLGAAELGAVRQAADKVPVVMAGNMSLGVNLLLGLTRRVAAALGTEFDIEIVEAHHRHKVDAPSGTALMLGEAAAEGRGVSLEGASERGRDGITGPRREGAIGFSSVRGGDVVGEHDVIFAGPGERLVLRHLATDRAIFARGAVRAALWAQGRKAGLYDMMDVLGLGAD